MHSRWKIAAVVLIVAVYVSAGLVMFRGRSEAQAGPGPIFEFIAQGTANVLADTKFKKGPTTVLLEKATIPVGGAVPWHCHPGPTTFIVVQGVLTTFDADGTTHVLEPGDADVEEVGQARTSENL